jgi:hypothetical protein
MKLFFTAISGRTPVSLGLIFGAMALHGQTLIDLKTQSKSVDFSGASATKPVRTGTLLPASCGVGELFFLLGTTAGQNSYGCTAANTWTLQGGGGSGSGLPNGTGHANQVLSSDGTTAQWVAPGGDVTGAPQSMQVGGLQGRPVATAQPVDGQVLRWNNSAHDWEPGAVSAVANFSKTFNSTALVTITGTQHNLATANLIVNCYDNATPANLLPAAGVTVDPNTFNVAVTFASAKSGLCVVNGLGGSGLAPAAGGDLAGLLSVATVRGLQNRPVSSSIPADGQVLTWNQTAAQWQPQTSSGGLGGAQFSTLGVSWVNSTTLNLGVGCTLTAPCNVRFGNTVYSVSASSTAVLLSGVGSAYVYITSTGALTVGSNLSIACSGCATAASISGFPPNTIPLYIWNAVPSGWDPTGGTDFRSYLSAKVLAPGLGLTVADSGTQSTIAVDASTVPGYLMGTATLNFGTVSAASCTSELTITVTGGNPGDSVAPGWGTLLPANIIGMMRVSAGDTVGVKLCNPTGTATIIPSDIFRATIVRTL